MPSGARRTAFDVVDGYAGRPVKGRRWKSVAVKEQTLASIAKFYALDISMISRLAE
jgi:hypothetical protein